MPDKLPADAIAYLPWARQGLSARAAALAAAPVRGRLQLTLTATLQRSGDTIDTRSLAAPTLVLHGPPDVSGLDEAQVIRTEPPDLASGFEPNCFAAIEFDRPDLPWLFSPTVANAQQRCQPWITLVVLPESAAQFTPAGQDTLGRLACHADELPRVDEAWAWAHAQVQAEDSEVSIADLLVDQPRSLSRLVCARRLHPLTRYLACVVPTYELGRQAGLGSTITVEMLDRIHLQPAWDSAVADAQVQLPVYHYWHFSTGEQGDFESLARRLAQRSIPASLGTLAVDLSAPGWGVSAAARSALPMGGALRPLPVAAPWQQPADLTGELARVLDAPAAVADGLIGPPLYGQAYPRLNAVRPANAGETAPVWFETLNLDIRFRVAAGLGAQVVRIEQDALMAAAWDQLADQDRRNRQLRRMQLAEAAGAVLQSRTPLAGANMPGVPRMRPVPERIAARRSTEGLTPQRMPVASAVARRMRAPLALPHEASARGPAAAQAADDEERFSPTFDTPAGELLKDYFPQFLCPGLDGLPADSVTVLKVDRRFIEAFLVGLNHEIGREMLWRGYPVDPRGTPFQRFWPGVADMSRLSRLDQAVAKAEAQFEAALTSVPEPGTTVGGPVSVGQTQSAAKKRLSISRTALAKARKARAAAGIPGADIAPMATWQGDTDLGEHPPAGNPAVEPVVLVLKGQLLLRFPRAAVVARRAVWEGSRHGFGTEVRPPLFQIDQAPDITLLAFDLSESQLCGDAAPTGDPGWFLVLQESAGAARFGLDAVVDPSNTEWGGRPATWADLSWSHTADSEEALGSIRYLPLSVFAGTSMPIVSGASARATWGRTSADQAVITRQKPFQLAIHGSQWLAAKGTS